MGQIVRQDLILPIGTANTVVEVTSTAPLLSTDSATVGTGHHQQADRRAAGERPRLLSPRAAYTQAQRCCRRLETRSRSGLRSSTAT